LKSGNLDKYTEKLASNFNPCAVEALMCCTLVKATFLSSQYPSLETLVSEFLSQVSIEIDRASFGVTGPVVGSQARITNLPWIIEEVRV
jgi:glucokinase